MIETFGNTFWVASAGTLVSKNYGSEEADIDLLSHFFGT